MTTTPTANQAQSRPFNESIRKRLADYRQEEGLSISELAQELGKSLTRVSKYLSGKPDVDVMDLESRAEDILKNARRRKEIKVTLFPTSVTDAVASVCEQIRKTNDVGLIHGAAGIGKSAGAHLYTIENPATILLTATQWYCSAVGIKKLLFRAVETARWKRNMSYMDFIIEKLAGSNRLIILDNAQRLTRSARDFAFDLHDATGCPVALIGNPSVKEDIKPNDQHFSRIGIAREIVLKNDHAKIVNSMVSQLYPEATGKLEDYGIKVLENPGHLRAFKKRLVLAADLAGAPTVRGNHRMAFEMAHASQVNHYDLEGASE